MTQRQFGFDVTDLAVRARLADQVHEQVALGTGQLRIDLIGHHQQDNR